MGAIEFCAARRRQTCPFDEEFYKYLVTEYQERLPEVVFFLWTTETSIGKDVPFQLAYREKVLQTFICGISSTCSRRRRLQPHLASIRSK